MDFRPLTKEELRLLTDDQLKVVIILRTAAVDGGYEPDESTRLLEEALDEQRTRQG